MFLPFVLTWPIQTSKHCQTGAEVKTLQYLSRPVCRSCQHRQIMWVLLVSMQCRWHPLVSCLLRIKTGGGGRDTSVKCQGGPGGGVLNELVVGLTDAPRKPLTGWRQRCEGRGVKTDYVWAEDKQIIPETVPTFLTSSLLPHLQLVLSHKSPGWMNSTAGFYVFLHHIHIQEFIRECFTSSSRALNGPLSPCEVHPDTLQPNWLHPWTPPELEDTTNPLPPSLHPAGFTLNFTFWGGQTLLPQCFGNLDLCCCSSSRHKLLELKVSLVLFAKPQSFEPSRPLQLQKEVLLLFYSLERRNNICNSQR